MSTFCGCWYTWAPHPHQKHYFTQVALTSKTTILASTSRTVLTQTFWNPRGEAIPEAHYTFPLYDGVSVVSFKCTIGQRVIVGVVKEKQQARAEYKDAVEQGRTAGLLEQLSEASDVFTTKLGNIPEGEKVVVELIYLGELKQDAETEGVRFTIPTAIAPRYGNDPLPATKVPSHIKDAINQGGINIVVDIAVESGSVIRGIQSPSHLIAVTMGRKSSQNENMFQNNHASASLALAGNAELSQDFVIVVNAQGQDTPRALLETHSEHGRALMTTLVPKFNLPNAHPEIVFVVDRSGSMDRKIGLVVQALKVFLKSLPLSVKFNICSFGSTFSFLFDKSKAYDESNLDAALRHLEGFAADYGGTELQAPIEAAVKNRLPGLPLEIMVLTDGQIWNQHALFDFINKASKQQTRVFALGIGSGASTSLVEGMARAGDGFSQFVKDGETIDKRVVRMLKAALTPHISDYSLDVQYAVEEEEVEDDFEMVESSADSIKTLVQDETKSSAKSISLFDQNFKEEPTNPSEGRYDHLPAIAIPDMLQTPHKIPPLYAFNRTTVYLLLGTNAGKKPIKSIVLRATCAHGPLQLEIPVEDVGVGETIHLLAAKKATQELEEGRGWITEAKSVDGKLFKEKYAGDWERIVEREAVRLGTQFQVAGKHCSFVAIETGGEGEKLDKVLSVTSTQSMSNSRKEFAPGMSSGLFGSVSQQSMAPTFDVAYMEAPRCRRAAAPIGGLLGASPGSSLFASSSAKPVGGGGIFGFRSRKAISLAPPPPPPEPSSSTFSFGSDRKSTSGAGNEKSKQFFGLVAKRSPKDKDGSGLFQRKKSSFSAGTDEDEDEDESNIGSEPTDLTNTTMEQRMHCIIGLQEFNGSWKKAEQLLKIIGIDHKTYNSELVHVANQSVKATVLALAWLEVNAAKLKDIWVMVADKARGWLITQDGVTDSETLIESAKTAFFPDDE